MIKVTIDKEKGSLEMKGSTKTVTCELAMLFEQIAERHEDIFLAALWLYEAGRCDDND